MWFICCISSHFWKSYLKLLIFLLVNIHIISEIISHVSLTVLQINHTGTVKFVFEKIKTTCIYQPFSSSDPLYTFCSSEYCISGPFWEVEDSRHWLVWTSHASQAQRIRPAFCHEDPRQTEGKPLSEESALKGVCLCVGAHFLVSFRWWNWNR